MSAHKPGTNKGLAATYVGIRNPRDTPTSHLVCSGNAKWAQGESALTRFHFPRRLMTVACATQGTLGGISGVGTGVINIIVFTDVLVFLLLL